MTRFSCFLHGTTYLNTKSWDVWLIGDTITEDDHTGILSVRKQAQCVLEFCKEELT